MKKIYCDTRDDFSANSINHENKTHVLLAFWQRLCGVKKLSFQAKTHSKAKNGCTGIGQGKVISSLIHANVLLFQEKGVWKTGNQRVEINFSNVFRWDS